jgi:NADH-quinone oxidoreductase subunit F
VAVREIILADAADRDLARLSEYRAVGGYETLAKARGMEPQQIVDELIASNLRGRGGAGFPMGRKASFLAKGTGRPTYLVVNADESEPGTFKDREIMLRVPHRLLEGCLITAHGIESRNVFIYLRGEYLDCFEALRAALEELREDGSVLGDVTVVVHRGAGAYICGEESALLESLEGDRGQPRSRPPFPAVSGLYASPTLINNVQTIATVPSIVENGGGWYASIGPESSPGTVVFSLSGNVVRPGNYELELGTPLRELIYDIGGGIPDGRELKAIIPGGSSVPVLTPDQIDTPLDFNSVAEAGSALGAAAVIVIDDRCCIVQLALRASQFYMHESCGKCTPCREGTRWLVQLLRRIEDGGGEPGDLDLVVNVADRMQGKSLCALGDFAAWPVVAYVAAFRAEFQEHIERGACPFGGESSLEGLFAPVDQHGHSREREWLGEAHVE